MTIPLSQPRLLLLLALALPAAVMLSLLSGSQALPLWQAIKEGVDGGSGVYGLILMELRLP